MKVKVNGKQAKSYLFEAKKGRFEPYQVNNIVDKFQKKFQDRNFQGKMLVNALFDTTDGKPAMWRNLASFTDIKDGEFDFGRSALIEDYFGRTAWASMAGTFRMFQVVVTSTSGKQGGNDPKNDCLWNCLDAAIPNLRKFISCPESLKEICEIKRCAKVPLSKLGVIEEKLTDHKLLVFGDHSYNSEKIGKYQVNILLNKEHFTLINNNIVRGTTVNEKHLVLFMEHPKDPNKIKLFSGENLFNDKPSAIVTKEVMLEMRRRKNQCPYIFVPVEKDQEGTLSEQWERNHNNFNILKELTEGKYNLFKCGTYRNAILKRFYELNPSLNPAPIKEKEGKWIQKALCGALIWATTGYEGPGHQADLNSAYPTVLQDEKFRFPIKCGEFHCISQGAFQEDLHRLRYGIYRVKIEGIDKRLFVEKNNGYYTHMDINRAVQLNYKVTIIEDDKDNCLLYSGKECTVNGHVVFKKFVSELYGLKEKYPEHKKLIKKPLNMLWGLLCKKHFETATVRVDEEVDLIGNVKSITPYELDDNFEHVKTKIQTATIFESPFARLGPFLLARTRALVSRIIEPHVDKIVRVHTDGFISTEKLKFEKDNLRILDSVKYGTGIGDLKYEGYCETLCIKNVNKVIDTTTGEKAIFEI
jgi:hypothetical protein